MEELCEERQFADGALPDDRPNNDVEASVNRADVEKSTAIALSYLATDETGQVRMRAQAPCQ